MNGQHKLFIPERKLIADRCKRKYAKHKPLSPSYKNSTVTSEPLDRPDHLNLYLMATARCHLGRHGTWIKFCPDYQAACGHRWYENSVWRSVLISQHQSR